MTVNTYLVKLTRKIRKNINNLKNENFFDEIILFLNFK